MMKDGKIMVMKDGKTMMKESDCMDINGKMCTDKMKKTEMVNENKI